MKIKKFGQCCLLIEVNGVTILTDPGRFSNEQDEVIGIDYILITHEHGDHLHTESLRNVLANNPEAKVITNSGVGKILEAENIIYELLEGTAKTEIGGLVLEAFDGKHAEIYEEVGQVQNTGYFIAEQLFYPGDAYTNPEKPVPVLALPVSGPWCKTADAIRYAVEVEPEKAFPVHDAVLNEEGVELVHTMFENILSGKNVEFVRLKNGEEKEF